MNEKELRELDVWIAEHVMGFVWARDAADRRSDYPPKSKFKKGTRCLVESKPQRFEGRKTSWDGWVVATGKEPLAPCPLFEVPHYSTDPAAAMEVLKKIGDSGKCFEGILIWKSPMREWTVECKHGPCERAPTLETAISLFARKVFSK